MTEILCVRCRWADSEKNHVTATGFCQACLREKDEKEGRTIYADPSQPHPWANKTAAEILKEMSELLDLFKVKIPDPVYPDLKPGPLLILEPFEAPRFEWPTLSKAPGHMLPVYAALVMDEAPACDCGADKAKTTHADWCSTKGGTRT
jgi:hypothetical protein